MSAWESPGRLGRLELRNRVAVAAMSRMQAQADGRVSADMPAYYARYARFGAGLVISEALYTDTVAARAYFDQPGLATDEQAAGWRGVVEAVHAAGGVCFAQLQHGGRLAEPGLGRVLLAASDGAAAGPTWQTGRPNAPAQSASEDEIEALIAAFAAAAVRAVDAGFDGVELHGARGYLLDDFLSASSNRRSDRYGGSLEGRLRLPLEVVRRVRAAVGPDVPLSYNLSLYKMDDNAYAPPGGAAEVRTIAQSLHGAGADILHVTTRRVLRPEAWGETLARTVRDAVPGASLIVNGGMRSAQDCDAALAQTGADGVSLARAFLANPDWPQRARIGAPMAAYTPGLERRPLLGT